MDCLGEGARFTYHYHDNFIVVSATMSGECAASLEILLETCKELGIPVAVHKCMGPTTCLVVLGILIDTKKMETSLPEENLTQLKRLLANWKEKKVCTRTELESLIGHLQYAAKVVWQGRRFIRGMLSFFACHTKTVSPH